MGIDHHWFIGARVFYLSLACTCQHFDRCHQTFGMAPEQQKQPRKKVLSHKIYHNNIFQHDLPFNMTNVDGMHNVLKCAIKVDAGMKWRKQVTSLYKLCVHIFRKINKNRNDWHNCCCCCCCVCHSMPQAVVLVQSLSYFCALIS